MLLDKIRVARVGIVMASDLAQPPRRSEHTGFYRAFEDRFRGSRDTVRSRLRAYLPFIEPLKSLDQYPAAVDLGCGRGEWLEFITARGFNAQGVDLDEGMLAACHDSGVHVTKEDAIAFLEKMPSESQMIVSGFHVAEHLPFSQLQILIQEALRVLKPAGLLILETPNPENFNVSTLTFYFDPAHLHPLPPDLLLFLTNYYGFARTKTVRLQEDRALIDSQAVSLGQVLRGASRDYAIIAQKTADADETILFDSAFGAEYGLDALVLVERFDRQLVAQNERTAAIERRIATILDEERDARIKLQERLDAMLASPSWKITAPLRSAHRFGKMVRRTVRIFINGFQNYARAVLAWVGLRRPRKDPQKERINAELSPRAQKIYTELKGAIAKRSEKI